MKRFVVLIDTPSIKQFVFGTDALAEIRGASALLDRLNRTEWELLLRQQVGGADQSAHGPQFVDKVYANGGSAQFLVGAHDPLRVETALQNVARYCAEQTGYEVQLVWGIGEIDEGEPNWYQKALLRAFSQMRWKRLSGMTRRAVPTFPLVEECQSTSYLPAIEAQPRGPEIRIVSEAAKRKYDESRRPVTTGVWAEFIRSLHVLPHQTAEEPASLRCRTLEDLGEFSEERPGYVGLVYADGNAMGRLVQELSSPEITQVFSRLVDGSIREACFQALAEVLQDHIERVSKHLQARRESSADSGDEAADEDSAAKIPADILLLGGDDLVVVVPAERALPFAIRACELFEELTLAKRRSLSGAARDFFDARLKDRGLTISCGVVIGPARYPFYLLLNLAEELLASAKRGGSTDAEADKYWAPSYIDFHIQAGSATQDLHYIREKEYQVGTTHARTLRPYRREKLKKLLEAARSLNQVRFPRSKLHDLFEAALEPQIRLADWKAKELFVRLSVSGRHGNQRMALWQAMSELAPVSLEEFPWTKLNGKRATVLADLIEVYHLAVPKKDQSEA